MLTFCLVSFAIGALLASIMSACQFVVAAPLLIAAAIALKIQAGSPLGQTLHDVIVLFLCTQLGYVAGVGLMALAVAKLRRSKERAAPAARPTASTINRASPQ